jgi:hypothetical protein
MEYTDRHSAQRQNASWRLILMPVHSLVNASLTFTSACCTDQHNSVIRATSALKPQSARPAGREEEKAGDQNPLPQGSSQRLTSLLFTLLAMAGSKTTVNGPRSRELGICPGFPDRGPLPLSCQRDPSPIGLPSHRVSVLL